MPISDMQVELLEKSYFDQLEYYLLKNSERMLDGLHSKNSISNDWIPQFTKKGMQKQKSDLDKGAERIFYWLLTTLWTPNSSPVGSDLFFETHNAFIHIEIKTAKINNEADYKGKVPIGENQHSYSAIKTFTGKKTTVVPNLPEYYNSGKKNEKPCLTYALQIIHENKTLDIAAILLICIPNGQLKSIYGNKIVGGGKTKDSSFRYEYKEVPIFQSISTAHNKYYRVKFLYFNKNSSCKKEDITTIKEIT